MNQYIWPETGTIEQFIDAYKIGGAQSGTPDSIWHRARTKAAFPVVWCDDTEYTTLRLITSPLDLMNIMEIKDTNSRLIFLLPEEKLRQYHPNLTF